MHGVRPKFPNGYKKKLPAIDRFMALTTPEPNSGCLIWTACCNAKGYGRFRIGGKTHHATRFIWEQAHGQIPAGGYICHKCDNPACVNTSHLFLGTAADNTADMCAKGRACFGERAGSAKLNMGIVEEIRRLAASVPQKDLAARFGVSASSISAAQCGRTWKNAH